MTLSLDIESFKFLSGLHLEVVIICISFQFFQQLKKDNSLGIWLVYRNGDFQTIVLYFWLLITFNGKNLWRLGNFEYVSFRRIQRLNLFYLLLFVYLFLTVLLHGFFSSCRELGLPSHCKRRGLLVAEHRLQGSQVSVVAAHGPSLVLQGIFLTQGSDLFPALQVDSLPAELSRKPHLKKIFFKYSILTIVLVCLFLIIQPVQC